MLQLMLKFDNFSKMFHGHFTATHFSQPPIFYTATFQESGCGYGHLASLVTRDQ
jgi:hypothetical protein